MWNNTALKGVVVLVTRPKDQAQALCHLIESVGGNAINVPAYNIVPPDNTASIDATMQRLDSSDIAIFVSANAVTWGVDWLRRRGKRWPASLSVAAVGKSTARELTNAGLKVDLVPTTRFNSEGLLAIEALNNVSGKEIVIFRGEGGREHLADTLRQRGASVEYIEVYKRQRPLQKLEALLPVAVRDTIDIILITSNEGLENLYEMARPSYMQWLLNSTLVVISERSKAFAQRLGFNKSAWVSAQATNQAIVDTIITWRQQQQD